ncbi:MAG: hypothetical protein JNL11_05970 [Bdellovibrionaceae bacterium]|nr:hypothetical protein [Pseudobdellovibrionaceae bacterium]
MKYFIATSMLVMSMIVSQAAPLPLENRAVRVRVMGGFTGFDADAYRIVRSGMAFLLADGVIDHFITREWGHEGGHEFCVELNPDPTFKIERITNMLAAIKPGKNTIYEYEAVLSCESLNEN